jgi:hypothetical protein
MDLLKPCFNIMIIVSNLFLALPALGQSFAIGYVKYQKGDFAGAETALAQALKTTQDPGERVKILKFRGIVQYMLGNQNGAASTFKEALSQSPSLVIDAADVLDETVVQFFEDLKRKTPSQSTKTASSEASLAAKPSNLGNSTAKSAKKTLLKIISTPTETQISIDSILAGRGGELINTDPGTVPVTVSAAGYESKMLDVTITKDRENVVLVTLEKIKSKPKPEPKHKEDVNSAALMRAASKKNPAQSARKAQSGAEVGLSARPPSSQRPLPLAGQAPGGPDLAQQFDMDAAGASTPPAYSYPPAGYGGYPGYYPGYSYRPGYGPYRYRNESPEYLILVLPFGMGQFYQDRTTAGLFFFATEALGISSIVSTYSDLEKNAKKEADLRTSCPASTDENYRKECETFIKDFPTYRRKATTLIAGASAGVFALMLIGAVEAIIKDPSYQAPVLPRRPRRASAADGEETIPLRIATQAQEPSSWHWHVTLLPFPGSAETGTRMGTLVSKETSETRAEVPGILWDVEWNF